MCSRWTSFCPMTFPLFKLTKFPTTTYLCGGGTSMDQHHQSRFIQRRFACFAPLAMGAPTSRSLLPSHCASRREQRQIHDDLCVANALSFLLPSFIVTRPQFGNASREIDFAILTPGLSLGCSALAPQSSRMLSICRYFGTYLHTPGDVAVQWKEHCIVPSSHILASGLCLRRLVFDVRLICGLQCKTLPAISSQGAPPRIQVRRCPTIFKRMDAGGCCIWTEFKFTKQVGTGDWGQGRAFANVAFSLCSARNRPFHADSASTKKQIALSSPHQKQVEGTKAMPWIHTGF